MFFISLCNVIILLINLIILSHSPMIEQQLTRAASSYARSKVQQIRKKFGYPTNQILTTSIHHTNTKTNINTSSTITNQNKQNKIPVTSTPAASKDNIYKYLQSTPNSLNKQKIAEREREPYEYENRIKNINEINKKITNILKQRERFDNINIQQNKQKQKNTQTYQPLSIQKAKNIKNFEQENIIYKRLNYQPPLGSKKNQSFVFKQKIQNIYLKQLQNKLIHTQIPAFTPRTQFLGLNSKQTISVELPRNQIIHSNIINKQKGLELKQKDTKKEPKLQNKEIKLQDKSQPIIQNFANKIEQQQKISKKQTLKLAQALNQQISKDQNLRYAKWVFSQWESTQKWTLLQQKLVSYSLDQIKKIFTLSPQQHNPFFQFEQPPSLACIQNLVKFYEQAKIFWQKSIKECVSIQSLQKQYFNVRDIDLGKKGYLSVQDVVCFVNLYTGKFYRNRDAIGLFKRFSESMQGGKTDQIKYEWFLETITK